jgi:CRP-like cAMP-binding protein
MILKDRYNFLNNIFLFECLDKISKYNVAQKMQKKEFSPNTKIITQGEQGNTLYIKSTSMVAFSLIIKPHVLPSMYYKLGDY